MAEQENVRSLIRVLRARFGNWATVERTLPISHGMRVDLMAGRYEVSAAIAFRVAKTFDVSLHCGRPVDG